MATNFGPTFAAEIAAAGLAGLPFAWTGAGEITGRERLTTAQNAALDAVIAAHDPTKPAPAPYVPPTPREWMARLSQEKQIAVTTAAAASPALMLWVFRLMGATFVDVTDAETIAGVNEVVAAGIGLTADDAAVLLAP